MFKIPTSLMYALSQQKNLALHQRYKHHEKMATSKDHSKVKKERKETHTYTEQPGDLVRAPSELALGASKAGSYPKQQGDKSTEAFPHVSSPPPHGSKAWLMAPLAAAGVRDMKCQPSKPPPELISVAMNIKGFLFAVLQPGV